MIYPLSTRKTLLNTGRLFNFLLFRRRTTISSYGLFSYYKLTKWWEGQFTEKEKIEFQQAFEKCIVTIPFACLFTGGKKPLLDKGKKISVVGFLEILLSGFIKYAEYDNLTEKILIECSEFVNSQTEVFELLTFYSLQMTLYSRLKEKNEMFELPFMRAYQNKSAILNPSVFLAEVVF